MCAPTAKGAAATRPARTTPRMTVSRPKVATTSPSQSPPPVRVCVDHSTAGRVEHEVGDDRAGTASADLGADVGERPACVDPSENPIGQRHHRVEVGAGDLSEGQDQRHEPECRGRGVLQQLQSLVARRQSLGEDARPHDGGHQETCPHCLRDRAPSDGAPVAHLSNTVAECRARAERRQPNPG